MSNNCAYDCLVDVAWLLCIQHSPVAVRLRTLSDISDEPILCADDQSVIVVVPEVAFQVVQSPWGDCGECIPAQVTVSIQQNRQP